MLVNPIKTKVLVICMSRSLSQLFSNLLFDANVPEGVAKFKVLES